ncbi:class I SAM-dependent methyltransferase [Paucibacter sp. TC2R-5]|uniref:class I SAM-dependent methyltransferase n=1 Tax=Paucibacter sp. TC2R-5 TaxID=2893555 RepID=UPI0021E3D4F9|nr:class I SAM-dependent methyltransferase [Paucibacter sp. TC2R-5]MCV2361552.1 class I SAM-dependent methyltransferase [Paucibacter sp. TC2R-5]
MQALLSAIATMGLPLDAQRIFHGRGARFPGCEQWALDAFPPVFLLTSFEPASEDDLKLIHAALTARWQDLAPDRPLDLVYQYRDEGRSETRLLSGSVPEPHLVSEQDSRYQVHLLKGQNHGLFLDMAGGRRWVREHAQSRPGIKVLNLFAYTCAFSVVALQAGAGSVVNVDMSSGALNIGRQNHQINGLDGKPARASFLAHDIFNSWGKISRSGPYDLIILDPPSFQKGSFVATKDYARLLRRLPNLLAPGGHAMLCLNTPKLGLAFLLDQMLELAPQLAFVGRVANPPAFADISEDRSLKVLIYKAAD